MCGPDIPEPPSPTETSAAQTGTNVATAIANTALGAVDQFTPDGSLTYSFGSPSGVSRDQFNADWYMQQNPDVAQNYVGDAWSHWNQHGRFEGRMPYEGYTPAPGANDPNAYYSWTDPSTGQTYQIPRVTATTTLSPQGEQLRDLNNETRTNMATVGRDASAFLGDYLTERPELRTTYGTDWSADRKRVEDAMLSRLQPQFARDRDALQTRLANQGITPGSEAWAREIEAFERSVNDARTGVVLAGGDEQSRLAGLDRDRAMFENTATIAGRNQPLNEIIGLLSGTQVQTPSFGVAQPSQMPTTDVAGNIWNNYTARANKAKAEPNLLGGLWNVATTAIPGSSLLGGWMQ